jgi:hypothetical protein
MAQAGRRGTDKTQKRAHYSKTIGSTEPLNESPATESSGEFQSPIHSAIGAVFRNGVSGDRSSCNESL